MIEEKVQWIGPSKCDDERFSRQNDIDEIWKIVKPMLEHDNFIPSTYTIVRLSLDLLREAMNCYQNGAFLATCGICRTTIEALLYASTTRKPKTKNQVIHMNPGYVRKKRGIFLNDALRMELIDTNDKDNIDKIWLEGDFAMHIHQKLDKEQNKFAEQVLLQGHQVDKIKGWHEKDETLNILRETTKLISKIMNRFNSLQTAER